MPAQSSGPASCINKGKARWCIPVRGLFWLVTMAIMPYECRMENYSLPPLSYLNEAERRDGGLTVRLSMARSNALATRLVVVNNSSVPVSLSKEDITLQISDNAAVYPVEDYGEYVYHRLRKAKHICDNRDDLTECRQAITEYFMPYLRAQPFSFGPVKAGETREGVIAFNMLDPYDNSTKAKRLRKSLDTVMRNVRVTVTIKPKSNGVHLPFAFPFIAEVVREPSERAFGVLRFSK